MTLRVTLCIQTDAIDAVRGAGWRVAWSAIVAHPGR